MFRIRPSTLVLVDQYKNLAFRCLELLRANVTTSLVTRSKAIKVVSTCSFWRFKQRAKQAKTKRKLAHPMIPMQRQLNFKDEGTHFDLRPIFDRLNERYFRGRLRGYKVMWGQRRRHRPREYFVFGTIQEEDRVIRINPSLDQPFVPLWFLQYVLYHEMLHSVVPDESVKRGRRRVHTEEFNRRERECRNYRRAARGGGDKTSRVL